MTAARTTLDALLFSLRERGTVALTEVKVKFRLGELDDEQMLDIAGRLQRLKHDIAPAWTDDDVQALFAAKEKLR